MTQTTLFDISTPAPVLDTRAKAHEKVKPTKHELHIRLLKSFYSGEWCADEWAQENGLSILSVRPRVSELNKAELLHRIGYGFTQDGNQQDKFTLYPLYKLRIETLINQIGREKAFEYIAERVK